MSDTSITKGNLEQYKVNPPTTLNHRDSKYSPWVSNLGQHRQLPYTFIKKSTTSQTILTLVKPRLLSTIGFLHRTHQVDHRTKNHLIPQGSSCTQLLYNLPKICIPYLPLQLTKAFMYSPFLRPSPNLRTLTRTLLYFPQTNSVKLCHSLHIVFCRITSIVRPLQQAFHITPCFC